MLNHFLLQIPQLSQKDPDEIEVERDFTIRKRIKGIYNKTQDTFPSDLDYRNYEETVEDVIYNLVNNIDVELTNKQVERYQKDHLQQVLDGSVCIGRCTIEQLWRFTEHLSTEYYGGSWEILFGVTSITGHYLVRVLYERTPRFDPVSDEFRRFMCTDIIRAWSLFIAEEDFLTPHVENRMSSFFPLYTLFAVNHLKPSITCVI